MTDDLANSVFDRPGVAQTQLLCHAPVTLFALPKPFTGDAARIQGNAIGSWRQLSPAIDILLFGDEEGIGEYAASQGIAHVGQVDRNDQGTPLVSGAFSLAHEVTTSPVLVYCNADVILDRSFAVAMERLSNQRQFEKWLAIGQRIDVAIDRELDFESQSDLRWLERQTATSGQKSSHVCKEFFAFSRNLFTDVPPFAVGRGNWDNWMVASVKKNRVPVIDLSTCVKVIHQAHDYAHARASRVQCYVSGEEARENERLAGGRHLISGTTCTHRLGKDGLHSIGLVRAGLDFLMDVPRFARLLTQLYVGQ